jgi:predicted RND superfamily exporter protein
VFLSFLFVMAFYGSFHAGWLMVLPMIFATILTYAYMGINNISVNINTVPVIAVGIGVGIDYAIYIMNRIREEMAALRDLPAAVMKALATTGFAVTFTPRPPWSPASSCGCSFPTCASSPIRPCC